ncbi:MAG: chemotaxis protein CheD [Solirubrobacteraceae bacterium]
MALGLGSCIGLAVIDRAAGVAGMAHVVLPESGGAADQPGKFADTAVPELVAQLQRSGAVARRLEAVLAGGAGMFQSSGGLDIGARNERAVRDALAAVKIPVRAARTGGAQGRTLKVTVWDCEVTMRVAGAQPETLIAGAPSDGAAKAESPLAASALKLAQAASKLAAERSGSLAGLALGGGGRL